MPSAMPREECDRDARIAQWLEIVEMAGSNCVVGRQTAALDVQGKTQVLENVLAGKATGTLVRRASSVGLFAKWYREYVEPNVKFPPGEATVFADLERLRTSRAPPTRARGSSEALNFCSGVIGLEVGEDVTTSRRVTGSATRSWETKRLTKQAPAVPAEAVRKLEECVLGTAGSRPVGDGDVKHTPVASHDVKERPVLGRTLKAQPWSGIVPDLGRSQNCPVVSRDVKDRSAGLGAVKHAPTWARR